MTMMITKSITMTQFNPKKKKILTVGESLDPAMKITDPEDAKQYKKAYVEYLDGHLKNNPDPNGKSAEEVANSNLGYYAGYFSHEVRERVEKLFECAHPVFGSIKENGPPTPEQAFQTGLERGAKLRKKD